MSEENLIQGLYVISVLMFIWICFWLKNIEEKIDKLLKTRFK